MVCANVLVATVGPWPMGSETSDTAGGICAAVTLTHSSSFETCENVGCFGKSKHAGWWNGWWSSIYSIISNLCRLWDQNKGMQSWEITPWYLPWTHLPTVSNLTNTAKFCWSMVEYTRKAQVLLVLALDIVRFPSMGLGCLYAPPMKLPILGGKNHQKGFPVPHCQAWYRPLMEGRQLQIRKCCQIPVKRIWSKRQQRSYAWHHEDMDQNNLWPKEVWPKRISSMEASLP